MTEDLKWIERLPEGWSVEPLKFVAHVQPSNVNKIASDDEIPVRLCNYTDVYKNEFIVADMDFMCSTATEREIEKFRLEVDDVIITKDSETADDIAIPAYVKETADDLVCGYHLTMMRPNAAKLSGRYLHRVFGSKELRAQLELAAKGVTRVGIPQDAIGRASIPIPPLPTQRRIADYLDAETQRIDELIAAKRSMLALLEKKRAALVSQAVTKGLDPNAKMKDSGLEWLGEIPEGWAIKRGKNIFRVRDVRSVTGEEELMTVSHITGTTPRAEKTVYMFKAEDNVGYKICMRGDLVVNTLWAWAGAMGVSPQDGLVSPDYHVYEPTGLLLPEFVEVICRSKPFVAEVQSLSTGVWTSRMRIYPETFLDIRFPIPPKSEQRAIVNAIASERERVKSLVDAMTRSIDLLVKRRSALITAAVTGQVAVRELVKA